MNKKGTDKGPVDLLGRLITVGDIVVYPVTVGRSAAVRIGEVTEIFKGVKTKGAYDPNPNSWHFQIAYANEGMDWGLSKEDPKVMLKYHQNALTQPIPDYWHQGEYQEATGWGQRGGYLRLSDEEAEKAWRKHHEAEIRKCQKKIDAGPKPQVQTLYFPEKSVVITAIYRQPKESV
jgi:hypothetical protein